MSAAQHFWTIPTPRVEANRSVCDLLAVNLLSSVLQALQSLGRFANKLSVGTFAAECRARVTARIHSQGPEAIRIQIQQSGQLLVLLLMGSALSDWGEPGLTSP